MKKWLIIALLFSMGSVVGWFIELIFRRFFSAANPQRKWINPGFLAGPYLPLYGLSLCTIYFLSLIDVSFIQNSLLQDIVLFVFIALSITGIEYIAGLIFIKGMHVELWDYSNEKFNIKGIICLKFTFFWYILSALYYFLLHPKIIHSIEWLAGHLAFSFFIGVFYGIFIIDLCYSLNILKYIREFAQEKEVIVHYEQLRAHINERRSIFHEKQRFIFTLKLDHSTLKESLQNFINEIKK